MARKRADPFIDESRIRNLLSQLLTEAGRDEQIVVAADSLKQELMQELVADQLPELIERVGALVMQRMKGLERMRLELEELLGQLAGQLDSLNRHVEEAVQDESDRSSSSAH